MLAGFAGDGQKEARLFLQPCSTYEARYVVYKTTEVSPRGWALLPSRQVKPRRPKELAAFAGLDSETDGSARCVVRRIGPVETGNSAVVALVTN